MTPFYKTATKTTAILQNCHLRKPTKKPSRHTKNLVVIWLSGRSISEHDPNYDVKKV